MDETEQIGVCCLVAGMLSAGLPGQDIVEEKFLIIHSCAVISCMPVGYILCDILRKFSNPVGA